jgi:ABC-2 type transport system ATP-binding protein
VEKVERAEDRIIINCESLQSTSLRLFELAQTHTWKIDSFKFEQGSLDDLFVNLVEKGRSA